MLNDHHQATSQAMEVLDKEILSAPICLSLLWSFGLLVCSLLLYQGRYNLSREVKKKSLIYCLQMTCLSSTKGTKAQLEL